MTDTILTILTIILGGGNIFQFIFFRQERKKATAQADEAETDSSRKKYELSKDQADYLLDNLSKVQHDYIELQEQVRSQAVKYTEEILSKCNIIADLKSQVVYLKHFRCYKSDCSMRVSTNPQDTNYKTDNEDKRDSDNQDKGV